MNGARDHLRMSNLNIMSSEVLVKPSNIHKNSQIERVVVEDLCIQVVEEECVCFKFARRM